MPDKLIILLSQSWTDLDRAVEGLTPSEATVQLPHASAIAWTVGHVTNMLDSWLNVRFQGLPAHPLIADPRFRVGGTGQGEDWPSVVSAVADVREAAERYLDSGPDLRHRIEYDGSIQFLRPRGLSLEYALIRTAVHHFMHVGDVLSVRARLGHVVPDNPDWSVALA